MAAVAASVEECQQYAAAVDQLCLVCTASWCRFYRRQRSEILAALSHFSQWLVVEFSVEGSDATEYVLHDLKVSQLPSIVVFRHNTIIGVFPLPQWTEALQLVAPATAPAEIPTDTTAQLIAHLRSTNTTLGCLFIAGDKAGVGKTSVCLGILAGLLRAGFRPNEIAYIKPATQNESEQPVARFCKANGIDCVPIGPVVFYKGFTRAFLNGATASSEELLSDIKQAVDALAYPLDGSRKVTIVDGVGYPAVGSICGVSNADVAATLGCGVLIVGKPGVGDAVDSFNLNASFFEAKGVKVLGAVFNKLDTEGFYSADKCAEAITLYFRQYRDQVSTYGFVPKHEAGVEVLDAEVGSPVHDAFINHFLAHFSMDALLQDMFRYKTASPDVLVTPDEELEGETPMVLAPPAPQPQARKRQPYIIVDRSQPRKITRVEAQAGGKTREQIEAEALRQGAGCKTSA